MTAPPSELAALERLVDPRRYGWSEQAAQAVVNLSFSDQDQERVSELADRANQGILTDAEESEMEGYLRLSTVMAVMQSKARLYLRELKQAA
ncbi:MAG TPA: hypothetical protein VGE39_13685 [Prosthecobacter sp.]